MKFLIFISSILFFFGSCKTGFNSGKQFGNDDGKVYKLQLKPSSKAKYYYTISNETKMEMEVNDEKITNTNKSEIGIYYEIKPDSNGNFLLSMTYDKLHFYSKNGDNESEMDADNARLHLIQLNECWAP